MVFSERYCTFRSSVPTSFIVEALAPTRGLRRLGAGLLHHSDRGSQYASAEYQARRSELGAQCSISRRGDCYDNAAVESIFSTLKTELTHGRAFH